MPSDVAIADMVAAAAHCLQEHGHDTIAEALAKFLIGTDFEAALGLRQGWRAHPRYVARQTALAALLAALPATPFAAQAARQVFVALRRYEATGWKLDRPAGRRPKGLSGLCYDFLAVSRLLSAERLRRMLPPDQLVTKAKAVTSRAA